MESTKSDEHEMKWRTGHSTVITSDRLYCWGGEQEDFPMVHHSDEKRKLTSTVDVFHLSTFIWKRESTTATPPAGIMRYACTNIRDNILYFGGKCESTDCYHNDLFALNTLTSGWKEINCFPDNKPMRKRSCGMISFNINREDNLAVIGGYGPTPITTHNGSQYIRHPNIPNRFYTDEIHTICVDSLPGKWTVPIITGDRPLPCADFTINALPDNRGVIFGGLAVDETGGNCVNDLFLLSFSQNTIDFQKAVKTTLEWPKARSHHASTIINTTSSDQQVISHLMVLGGWDDDLQTLNDCWIMNLSSLIWCQINLPDSVSRRYDHSMSTFYISNERFWIVVTGGSREYNSLNRSVQQIIGSKITVIIELEYVNHEWSMKHFWNYEELRENKREIQKRLIVDDRVLERPYETDLIDSSKSSSFIPHHPSQAQRKIQKTIFEKESKILNLRFEIIDLKDQIKYLKMPIYKSNTIDTGFLKNETRPYSNKKSSTATPQKGKTLHAACFENLSEADKLQMLLKKKAKELQSLQEQVKSLQTTLDKMSQIGMRETNTHVKTVDTFKKVYNEFEEVPKIRSKFKETDEKVRQQEAQVKKFKKSTEMGIASPHESVALKVTHSGTDRTHPDTSQVINCIKLVMENNHADLCRLFKSSLKTFAEELLQAGILTRDVQTNPTSDDIINCFLSGVAFKNDIEEIEKYCTQFFKAFYEVRGPYIDAANKIKKSIQESVRDELGIELNV